MKKCIALILVMLMVLTVVVGCTNSTTTVVDSKTLKSGTYTVGVKGHNAEMKVEVTIADNKIQNVKIISHNESPGISDIAINDLPKEIVEYQSVAVDAKSGATATSNAIIEAVKEAIRQAGGNEADFSKVLEKKQESLVKKEADVVIIGGGGAGMAAALSAAENGASVILIEKNAYLGGNTILAGGGYNSVDSERQSIQEMTAQQYETVQKIAEVEPKMNFMQNY